MKIKKIKKYTPIYMVFNFNIKAQRVLFPKDLTTWLTRQPFNVLMDIIIMLPKSLLFLKTFSTNKALNTLIFFCWGSDNVDVN